MRQKGKQKMEKCAGVPEKCKAEQPMKWAGHMEALREATAEIVNAEVVFALTKDTMKAAHENP